jgi:hypothetical protein
MRPKHLKAIDHSLGFTATPGIRVQRVGGDRSSDRCGICGFAHAKAGVRVRRLGATSSMLRRCADVAAHALLALEALER